jgi:lipopolysaccharide export LptBFGC system permease protein LptF
MLTQKEHEQYLFCARSGKMINDIIVLYEGTLCTAKDGHFYLASFHETSIDLGSLVDKNSKKEGLASVKYATIKNLLSTRLSDQESFVEFHKRVALIIWLIMLMIVAFWVALFLARASWLTGLLLSSLIFVGSYMAVAMGTVITTGLLGAFVSFYLPPLIFLLVVYIFLNKKN